jgi:hypothetical protein
MGLKTGGVPVHCQEATKNWPFQQACGYPSPKTEQIAITYQDFHSHMIVLKTLNHISSGLSEKFRRDFVADWTGLRAVTIKTSDPGLIAACRRGPQPISQE